MKILCLHGSGTSGEFFEYQISGFRALLDKNEHQFHYLNAPFRSGPGPGGIELVYEGPYYRWLESQDRTSVKAAAASLQKHLESQQQPYDLVIAFSQGCQLLVALMLYHRAEHDDRPLPFRAAMLICGSTFSDVLSEWIDIPDDVLERARASGRALDEAGELRAAKMQTARRAGHRPSLWDSPTPMWDGKDERDPSWIAVTDDDHGVYGLDLSDLRTRLGFQIPIVHVIGHKDPTCALGMQVAMLSEGNKRRVYDHGGGHEIPRNSQVSNDLAEAVRWLQRQVKGEVDGDLEVQ